MECGWVTDRFGVTWQVLPGFLVDMLQDKDAERAARVMHAMLQMTKFDIAKLKEAYEGRGLVGGTCSVMSECLLDEDGHGQSVTLRKVESLHRDLA